MDTSHYCREVYFSAGNRPLYPCLFDDQYDNDDDYTDVPATMQEDINGYILKSLFPDVLKHMSKFGFKGISGVEINHVSLHLLGEFIGSMEPAFNPKHQYDLYAMHRVFSLNKNGYCKKDGKELVGAAIRLSEAIGKEEHVNNLKQLVKDCFIPNVVPDPDDQVPFHLLF